MFSSIFAKIGFMITRLIILFFIVNLMPIVLQAQDSNMDHNLPHVQLGTLNPSKITENQNLDKPQYTQAQLLQNKILVSVEPGYIVTGFKFSIFSPAKDAKKEGGKIKGDYWGPFDTKGSMLTDKELDLVSRYSPATIFLEDIVYEKNGKSAKCANLTYQYK